MCKIITIINEDTSPEASALINEFLTAQTGALCVERDGYAVLRDAAASYHPHHKDYAAIVANTRYTGSRVQIIHARTATGGEKGLGGLHLQKIRGWYFAHNGTTSIQTAVKSDSYIFFDELLRREPTKKNIEKLCWKHTFRGRGILYRPETRRLLVFVNMEAHITALGVKTLAITSYKPILTTSTPVAVLGFTVWETSALPTIGEPRTIDDKLLTFENGQLVKTEKIRTTAAPLYGGLYYNGYNFTNTPPASVHTQPALPVAATPPGSGYKTWWEKNWNKDDNGWTND